MVRHFTLEYWMDEGWYVGRLGEVPSEAFQTMLASEAVLRRDWDRPEEDEAWASLSKVTLLNPWRY